MGVGAPMASGLPKSRGFRKGAVSFEFFHAQRYREEVLCPRPGITFSPCSREARVRGEHPRGVRRLIGAWLRRRVLVWAVGARPAGGHSRAHLAREPRPPPRPRRLGSAGLAITPGAERREGSQPSFFGLSIEFSELPLYEQVPAELRARPVAAQDCRDGPQVLRIGGDSADITFWNPGARMLPR